MACPDCNNTGTIPVTISNPVAETTATYSESCPCTYGGAVAA
jgi:hypothetical protein